MTPIRITCLAIIALTVVLFAPLAMRADEPEQGATIRVGIDDGDVRGSDNRAIQAAVDYVANLGGGTVLVGPGKYTLRNAVTLRDHVRLIGTPGKTVFTPVEG